MSEYRVGSIDNGNYGMVPNASGGAMTSRPQAQPPASQEMQSQTAPLHSIENNQSLAIQQKNKAEEKKQIPSSEETEKAALPLTSMANVVLKFKINEDTRDITLYVIDRETKRVLRSIPPEEMNKLQAGDILELLA